MVHRRGEEEGRTYGIEDGLVDLNVQVARLRKRSMVAAAASGGGNTVGEEEAAAGALAIQENVSQQNLLLLDSFKHAKSSEDGAKIFVLEHLLILAAG